MPFAKEQNIERFEWIHRKLNDQTKTKKPTDVGVMLVEVLVSGYNYVVRLRKVQDKIYGF